MYVPQAKGIHHMYMNATSTPRPQPTQKRKKKRKKKKERKKNNDGRCGLDTTNYAPAILHQTIIQTLSCQKNNETHLCQTCVVKDQLRCRNAVMLAMLLVSKILVKRSIAHSYKYLGRRGSYEPAPNMTQASEGVLSAPSCTSLCDGVSSNSPSEKQS